jgi:hypothetical protein
VASLIRAVLLFGVFSALTIWQQGGKLVDWITG